MPSLRFLALSVTIVVLAGCSRSDSEKQGQQIRMAASWTATTVLMLDGWLNSSVPSHYARRTSETVRKKLSELSADLRKGGAKGVFQQQEIQRVTGTLGQAERGIEALDRAVVQNSRNALAAAASRFSQTSSRHGP